MLSPSVVSESLWPHGLQPAKAPQSIGILQARILKWVAISSSRGSSQPKYLTQVSCITGGFFTIWAIREAQENWSGYPIPSPGDLPDPGIELGSPALQAVSLPAELPRKLKNTGVGSLSPLQGIFLTQESNWGLLHCRWILYQLTYQGSPTPDYLTINQSRRMSTSWSSPHNSSPCL